MSAQPYHSACAAAFLELAEADSEIIYSSLLELELLEACYQVALRERFGKKWKQNRFDGRARRRAARLAEQAMEAWSTITTVLPSHRVDAAEVASDVPFLMRRYGLGSYDAVHVATALAYNADALLALDSGFARVPARLLRIHTVQGKVSRMRGIRKGA